MSKSNSAPKNFRPELALDLRRRREEILGITQEEAAKQIGCSTQQVQKMETTFIITPKMQEKIYRWLGSIKPSGK